MSRLCIVGLLIAAALCMSCIVSLAQEGRTPTEQEGAERSETAEAASEEASAHEKPPLFSINVDGTKTWALRYGFGHPATLLSLGAEPAILSMDQSLVVDVTGEALSIFHAEARYNDQVPEVLESMALYLETDRLSGVLGDFTFTSVPGFTSYMKTMKGLQLDYRMGDKTLTAVASRAQGVPETLVFVGETTQAKVEYRFTEKGRESDRPAPYGTTLEGMSAYRLESLYTEEFSSVDLRFSIQQELKAALVTYEMIMLLEALETEPEWELKPAEFRVLLAESEEQVLLLSRDPLLLLRSRISDLITLHNKMNELSGDEAMAYPFVVGTDYERAFLESLAAHVALIVDQVEYPMVEGSERRRFFSLGRTDVKASTAVVEVSRDGFQFEKVTDMTMPDYRLTIHEEGGVVECDFPDDFYTSSSVMRITFSYQTLEGAFMLGLSFIPGSERVLLNSVRLQEGTDYAIDLETGVLFLLVDFEETDVLQIDYERYAGGFGTASPYARSFYGLLLDLPVSPILSIQMNLMQIADVARTSANLEGISTMPNQHTVVGMQADLKVDDLIATVRVGYNYDVFPFDSNNRIPLQNEVYAIASGEEFVFFGHRAGISVYNGESWKSYGVESGLSGRMVQSVAVHQGIVYMGTNVGLTTVRLEGASPFTRAGNWSRYFTKSQLPSASITALLIHNHVLWMGTEDGLVRMTLSETPAWERLAGPGLDSLPEITALHAIGGTMYVGTVNGAYVYDVEAGALQRLVGTEDDIIHDLATDARALYVASQKGLRVFEDGVLINWLVLGEPVYAVECAKGHLLYGTEDGALAAGDWPLVPLPSGHAVTALAETPDGIWIGSRATDDGRMVVWLLDQELQTFPESITGMPDQDASAFRDAPSSEHTNTGWMSTASFRQVADRYSITGSIELLQPTFRALGSSRRSDSAGWTATGKFSIWEWGNLSVRHDYKMTGHQDGTPSSRMSNNVSLTGEGETGLRWSTSLTVSDSKETIAGLVVPNQETTAGASIRETFFGKALTVDARWDLFDVQLAEAELSWQKESYRISYDWKLFSALSATGSWDRQLRQTEDLTTGTDQIKWGWNWEPSLKMDEITWVSADAQYTASLARSLSSSAADWLHQGSLRLTFADLNIHNWRAEPSLRAEITNERACTDLLVEATSRLVRDKLTLRGNLIGAVTGLGQPVHHHDLDWSANLRFTGIKTLDLSGTYTGSLRVATKGAARSSTSTNTISGRFMWTSDLGLRDDLSVSLQFREMGAGMQLAGSIRNNLSVDITARITEWLGRDLVMRLEGMPKGDLRVSSSAEYGSRGESSDLSFSTAIDFVVTWPPNGSISAGATYSAGWKEQTGLRSGLLLQAKVAINF